MRRSSLSAVIALLIAAPVAAQNPVDFAPDVTAPLGSAPALTVADENLAHDDAAGGLTGYLIPAGTLPANVEIAGYHALASGNTLLALDTTTALPGLPIGTPAEPRDVVEYAPLTGLFSLFFDGSVAGVPPSAQIDAVSVDAALEPQLSFETSTALPGLGPVDDEDVVGFSAGVFSIVYDGSAAGVPGALDVDAVQTVTGPAGFLISFDTSGTVGAVTFDDEDVVRYDSGLGSYAMYFDASLSDPADWPRADLSALPEPAALPGLAAAVALLGGLRRRRRGDVAAIRALSGVALGAVVGLGVACAAHASDGVLEINQACVNTAGVCGVAPGCFPGDTACFPVTLSQSGSYVLTGSLTLPNTSTDGIEVLSGAYTIDMNGFGISGPGTCTGCPVASCTGGTGRGIYNSIGPTYLDVRGGSIVGVGAAGIDVNNGLVKTENVLVTLNGAQGIRVVGGAGRFSETIVDRNGSDGVSVDPMFPATVVQVTSSCNTNEGIESGVASTVSRSATLRNGGAGIAVGIGSNVGGSSILTSDGFGIDCGAGPSGYSDNVLTGNNSGGGGAQASPACVQIGTNLCNGSTVCP